MRILGVSARPVRCLSYSPDGRLLATGDENGDVRLWSLPDGGAAGVLQRDPHSVETLAFHPTGSLLATGDANGDLVVWQLGNKKRSTQKACHPGGTRALAWTPDGTALTSAGWDKTIQFRTPTLQPRRESHKTASPVIALTHMPDGRSLVLADYQGRVLLWRNEAGQAAPPATWTFWPWRQRTAGSGEPPSEIASSRAEHSLFALAMSSSGELLATGDTAGKIDLWRLPQLQKIATLTGHEWTIYGLAFTPSGRVIVSGSADGTVRVWDIAGLRLVETFRWHQRWVTSVAVAPDGMTAAAGSADGTVVVWDLADV